YRQVVVCATPIASVAAPATDTVAASMNFSFSFDMVCPRSFLYRLRFQCPAREGSHDVCVQGVFAQGTPAVAQISLVMILDIVRIVDRVIFKCLLHLADSIVNCHRAFKPHLMFDLVERDTIGSPVRVPG